MVIWETSVAVTFDTKVEKLKLFFQLCKAHSVYSSESYLKIGCSAGETGRDRHSLCQLIADSTNQESVHIQFLFTITPVLNSFHDVNLCIMCQLLSKLVLISGVV
jgi:hypothetical protein